MEQANECVSLKAFLKDLQGFICLELLGRNSIQLAEIQKSSSAQDGAAHVWDVFEITHISSL